MTRRSKPAQATRASPSSDLWTVSGLMEAIDNATSSDQMKLREALDFLERLSTEIECRIEGIKDDLKNL